MKSVFFLATIAVLSLGSCVTARQYEELETRKNEYQTENEKLSKSNEQLKTQMNEMTAQVSDLDKRIAALKSDTTLLGSSTRNLRSQYDKINELNDILMNKNTTMLSEMTSENRQLLEDLQLTRNELQGKEDALTMLEEQLNEKESRLETLNAELEGREAKVNELQELLKSQEDAANALKDKIAAALLGFKDKGLTVEQKNGKVYVSLEAKLLFPSGSTVIDTEGKKALIELAKAIESQSDLEIIVEGHTDTDALKSTSIPRDNWELSVMRSTAVVKIMLENSQINPQILAASGRSEFHPIDPEDKTRNRRIEIIIAPNLNDLFNIIDSE
jgi:chemotaxis protein MotB